MPTSRKFFYTLDGIRGLAAIIVVIYHTGIIFKLGHTSHSYLAVDIFFILSGVVIANAYENRLMDGLTVKKFFTIRIIRLYPLYILGTLISILAVIFGVGQVLSLQKFVFLIGLAVVFAPNPFIGTPAHMYPLNFPAWSLFYELVGNVFYASTIRLMTNRVLFLIMLSSAIGLVECLYFLPDHDLNIGFTLRSSFAGFCRVGYSFFTGILLYRIYASGRWPVTFGRNVKIIPWIILACVGILLLFTTSNPITPYYDFVCVDLIFPGIVYLALHFEPVDFAKHIFKFLGAVSYALYAIHDSAFHLIVGIGRHNNINFKDSAPWLEIALIMTLIFLCWVIDKVYDGPIRRWLLNLLYNPLKPATAAAKA